VVSVEEVLRVALALPGSYQVVVRDQVKVRVGRYVYLAFSADETQVGFGFPKEDRGVFVAAEPGKFLMPATRDLRYHWIEARMAALDPKEMCELVTDAWRMCAPRRVRHAYDAGQRGEGA
jgi:hypothetical protein